MDRLKIAVIGTGRIGKVHVESLTYRIPETDVVAVADININEARKVGAQYRIQNVYDDYKKILDLKEVDAVLICSSTDTHAQITEDTASAGKHIFCEKPIDLSIERIKRTIKIVEESGVNYMLGFNRRFDPNFLKVREMVNEGKVGAPHIVRITSRDPEPPPAEYIRVSGGIFLDMAIHDFDMARYLVNSEVKEIYAKGGVLVDPVFEEEEDLDTAITTLTFENGAMGTIDNSRKAAYGYDQRVEVFGSKGMVSVNNNTPDNHFFLDETGQHKSLPLHFFMQRYIESYFSEIKTFVDCILNDKKSPVSGRDGLMSVAIGIAAKLSASENRPVKIEEII